MPVRGRKVSGGTGSGDSVAIPVEQVAHGLSVQDAIYFDGTNWLKAQADAVTTLGIGVVSAVADADNFTVITDGKITGLSGLTTGEWYYVSDATAGLLTTTESNIYSNPLLQATSATTGIVLSLRAQDIGGSSQRVTRSDYDSVNLQYLYTGTADVGSSTASAVWRISRYDFANGIIEYVDTGLYTQIYDNRQALTYA